MGLTIKPSDLYYRYPRKKEARDEVAFRENIDDTPFDRHNLYEVIPMFESVMDTLGSCDADVLQKIEEILNDGMFRCVESRREVHDCLVGAMRDLLGGRR